MATAVVGLIIDRIDPPAALNVVLTNPASAGLFFSAAHLHAVAATEPRGQ